MSGCDSNSSRSSSRAFRGKLFCNARIWASSDDNSDSRSESSVKVAGSGRLRFGFEDLAGEGCSVRRVSILACRSVICSGKSARIVF